MSKALDLLKARIANDARAEIRVKIHLDPTAASHLSELESELATLRQQAADATGPQKMNGRIADLATEIEEAEKHLLDAVAYVVLRALSSEQAALAASQITEDDSYSTLWKANLRLAFVRVEDADHQPVEDITSTDWAALLKIMSHSEVHDLHQRLSAADSAVSPI